MSEDSRFVQPSERSEHPKQRASVADAFFRKLRSHRRRLAGELATTTDEELTQRARSRAAQRLLERLMCLYFLLESDVVGVRRTSGSVDGEPAAVIEQLVTETNDPWETLRMVFFDRLNSQCERTIALDGTASLHLPYVGGLYAPLHLATSRGGTVEENRCITAASFDWPGLVETLNEYSWCLDGRPREIASTSVCETISPADIGAVSERFLTAAGNQSDRPSETVDGDDETTAESAVGAYYTDRNIAKFVARRALWQSLRQTIEKDLADEHAPPQLAATDLYRPAEDSRPDVEANLETGFDLLLETYPDDPGVRSYLDEKLTDLTVCDPAAGSGAFLMAVADTLYEWRSRLVPDADPTALRRAVVENSIHGVDLLGPAAEMCKFRLSLWVLQADIGGERGPTQPLPEVDESIRTGNSLIGVARPSGVLREGVGNFTGWSDRATVPASRTTGGSRDARSPVRASVDNAFVDRLHEDADARIRITDPVATPAAAAESIRSSPDAATLCVTIDDGIPDALASELAEIGLHPYTYKARFESPPPSESELATIYDTLARQQLDPSDWSVTVERPCAALDCAPDRLDALHWPFAFPDVFHDGGFDLIISNPPYGANVPPAAEPILTDEAVYESQGARDTCEWFYERALDLVHGDGVVAYVVTKSLAFYASWADIREKLLTETTLERVHDVGLGFGDVNLETIALVHTVADSGGGSPPVHRSGDPRSRTDNRPVHLGYADQSYMRDAGTILFRPISRSESDVLDQLLVHDQRLGDAMSTDATTRQLYIPDGEKADLPAGQDAYINKNHWVGEFTLADVWYCDLEAYRDAAEAYAVPRVMLKVLRGSRLRAWLDPYGELVGTEKLVNVPLEDHSPVEIAFIYAALNHPCASFYLQKAVFSETTETARVMDGQYSTSIPLPDVGDDAREAVAILAWTLTMAKAVQRDAECDLGPEIDGLQAGLEALLGALYLDLDGVPVDRWVGDCRGLGAPPAQVEALFADYYTERWAAPDGSPSAYREDIVSLAAATAAGIEDWATAAVLGGEAMAAVRAALR